MKVAVNQATRTADGVLFLQSGSKGLIFSLSFCSGVVFHTGNNTKS